MSSTEHDQTHDHTHDQEHDQKHGQHHEQEHGGGMSEKRMYGRFGLMILTSTVVMYLLTYTNLFDIDHTHVSLERIYMAVLMGSAMAIVMLGFMWGMMYKNIKVNVAIVVGALIVGGTAFTLSQRQVFVGDEAYMKAMIPHHSIAILTSERADFDDVRVQELADSISAAQVKEIKEMEWLLDDIDANGPATTQEEADQRPVPDFSAAEQAASRAVPYAPWAALAAAQRAGALLGR